ncbi:MAG: hypothetical protein ACP5QX_06660 [Caldisericaceae bacterium]
MASNLGPRVTIPEIFSILGSVYVEKYTGMLESFGIRQAQLVQSDLPGNTIVVTQFKGLAKNPDGSGGEPSLTDKNYTSPANVEAGFVVTQSEAINLKAKMFKLVDDKEIFTAFARNAGSFSGDALATVEAVIGDMFLSAMEDDLISKISTTNRKVSYTSQETGNAFSMKELTKAAITLAGRNALQARFSLIVHPNVYAAIVLGNFPDIYKLTNAVGVPNLITNGGIQFLQIKLSDKCPYDSSSGLYTSYLFLDGAVNYYIHTWELNFNPYGWGTYNVYIRNTGNAIDTNTGQNVYFFEGKWAFYVPDTPALFRRICEFKSTDVIAP